MLIILRKNSKKYKMHFRLSSVECLGTYVLYRFPCGKRVSHSIVFW